MPHTLLSPGQFAKLARTTKRTVLWYGEQGLLEPASVADNGYRYYEPRQIIDFQVILLLRKMGFSIQDIKSYLAQNSSLGQLFKLKEAAVKQEIADLKLSLNNIASYYHNLSRSGTLVDPKVVDVKPFSIYYIEKDGQYSKIKDYCLELKSHFARIPRSTIYLTVFFGDYAPNNAKMDIGVIAQDKMLLKKASRPIVQRKQMPAFKALRHVHHGSGAFVSLLWHELEKYAASNQYEHDASLPFDDFEVYKKTSLNGEADEDRMVFELYLPIKTKTLS